MSGSTVAAAADTAPPVALASRHTLFDREALPLKAGDVVDKWRQVTSRIEEEELALQYCATSEQWCGTPGASAFLAIIAEGRSRYGRARLGVINRAINLAIRPASDLALFGQDDVWQSPLATLSGGAGDCEDYAIAKFLALRRAGIAEQDVRVIILRNVSNGEDHAVVAARDGEHWLILDNRRLVMLGDASIAGWKPLFEMDHDGVRRYLDPTVEVALGAAAWPQPASADATPASSDRQTF